MDQWGGATIHIYVYVCMCMGVYFEESAMNHSVLYTLKLLHPLPERGLLFRVHVGIIFRH